MNLRYILIRAASLVSASSQGSCVMCAIAFPNQQLNLFFEILEYGARSSNPSGVEFPFYKLEASILLA